MNKQRKFVLIAAVVGIISMFLPWSSFFGNSFNGIHSSGGILVLLCFVASAIVASLGDQTKNLDTAFMIITLISGAIALLGILYFYIALGNNPIFGQVTRTSFGLYFAALAAIGILASTYIFRSTSNKQKNNSTE